MIGTKRLLCGLVAALAASTVPRIVLAQGASERVTITIPASVTFAVTDVTAATTGSPNPFRISFSRLHVHPHRVFRISVAAASATLTAPSSGGASIPVSSVTWTASNAVAGAGSNGTLAFGEYRQVYQSDSNDGSGGVELTWRLAAPGTGVRAGGHAVTLIWKLESVP